MIEDRASHYFKLGYWDRRDERPRHSRSGELKQGTFAAYDYDEGWSAADAFFFPKVSDDRT